MVRPDDSHSSRSARLNAIRSDTCSPQGSMIRSVCPRLSSNATPCCGSIRWRVIPASSVKWARPPSFDAAAGVLRRFGPRAEIGEHRVDVALQPLVAAADDLLEL